MRRRTIATALSAAFIALLVVSKSSRGADGIIKIAYVDPLSASFAQSVNENLRGLYYLVAEASSMDTDYKWLFEKNVEIGKLEAAGNRSELEKLLAPAFAFMNKDRKVVDRQDYLGAVKESPHRETTVLSITFLGSNRALVAVIVEMGGKKFHNLRLFVRPEREWKLLAWANEEITPSQ